MANIKSAKKRVLVSKVKNERNKAAKTALKTVLKKAKADDASAETIQLAAVSLDKAARKGFIHKNKAARVKSRLAKKANATV